MKSTSKQTMKYANNAKLPYLCLTTQATQDIKREKPNE